MPPVAASACEYASPTVPLGRVAVVIDSAASTVIDSARVAVWLAASLTCTVNACVSAVVGVPLPSVSYGGTAMVTLGVALGMLMSIAKSRRLMQS